MKYYYKVVKIENNMVVRTYIRSKHYNISLKKYNDLLEKSDTIKNHKNWKMSKLGKIYVNHKLAIITNNPHFKKLNYILDDGTYITEITEYKEPVKYKCYPMKQMLYINNILISKTDKIFFSYKNKIIFFNPEKPLLIVCGDKYDAHNLTLNLKVQHNCIYLGEITKKLMNKEKETILKIFNFNNKTFSNNKTK